MIVDQFGRPVTAKKPVTEEQAVSWIRDRYIPYVSRGLTADRLALISQEADQGNIFRQAELFQEMEEKDAHLASILQTRKLAVSGLNWEISPASDDSRDKKVADACRQQLKGIEDFDETLHHLMDAVGKGFSVSEIMWETGPEYRIKELKPREQRRFTYFNMNFEQGILEVPRVLTPKEPVYGEELLPWKFIIHEYRAKSGTVPRSALLRPCTWLYLFKSYTLKDWVTFCEVYGMPLRLGYYNAGTPQADKDALIKAVTMLGTDAAGIISDTTKIDFVETVKGTQGADVYKLFFDLLNNEMAKAILGQTLTSGTGGEKGGGKSFALGKVHDEVRMDLVKADARSLSRTIKHQLLRPYVLFNFGPDTPVPDFKLIVEDPKDLLNQIKIDAEAQKMGMKITEKYMRDTYGYPEVQADDEVLVPTPGAGNVDLGGEDGGAYKQTLKKNCLTSSRK